MPGATSSTYSYRWNSSAQSIVFSLLIGMLIIVPIIVLIRALGTYWIGHIYKFLYVFVVAMLASWICIRLVITPSRIRFDLLSLLMLSLFIYGTWLGLLNVATQPNYGWRQFISHFFIGFGSLIVYLGFLNWRPPANWFSEFIERTSPWILITFILALLPVYLVFLPLGDFYLGFSSDALILPFALFLLKRRYLLALLTLFVVLLSGKRGVLLALIALIPFFVFFRSRSLLQFAKASTWSILALVSLVGVAAAVAHYLPEQLGQAVDKINLLFTLADEHAEHAVDIATSGRSIEIVAGLEFLDQTQSWWKGLGYGFGFEVSNVSGEFFQIQHYVHFTPMNYLLQYGLVLAVTFYVLLFGMLVRATFIARRTGFFVLQWVTLVCWGNVIVSMTAYSVGSDPTYWMMIGILVRYGKELRQGIPSYVSSRWRHGSHQWRPQLGQP
jgi:hypothetical protein